MIVLLGPLFYRGPDLFAEESLFKPALASSPLIKKAFSLIDSSREKIIDEWIRLTEIPSPSGKEGKRAEYMKAQFVAAGFADALIDTAGNAMAVWKGRPDGKKILVSAHMDTVFQQVDEIKVKREGGILKAPGVCDDTASCVNLLWTIRALKAAGFDPANTYYFLASVEEETGMRGVRTFLEAAPEKVDLVVALDGDLGELSYGALGFGGGRITFRGPGAHTMKSRGAPNPNLALAKAIERIYGIELPAEPIERWTIVNIGVVKGGTVQNAMSQESSFTVDLRSADQDELDRARNEIKRIAAEVASEEKVEVEVRLNDGARAHQLPGARDSYAVKTVVDILMFLGFPKVDVNPLGSTEANVGIEKGILSVNLGRTTGRNKHSLEEEADIDGIFLGQKQLLLLIGSLETK